MQKGAILRKCVNTSVPHCRSAPKTYDGTQKVNDWAIPRTLQIRIKLKLIVRSVLFTVHNQSGYPKQVQPRPSTSEITIIVCCQGLIVYYIPGGEYNFLRGLILGVNFQNAQNVRGGRNIKTQDWPSMKKLSNYIMIEVNSRFLRKWTKNIALAVLCWQQNVSRVMLGPGTYQLFLLRLCVQLKSGKNIQIFVIS